MLQKAIGKQCFGVQTNYSHSISYLKEAINFYLDHILIAISANFSARSAIDSSFDILILGVSKSIKASTLRRK